VHVIGAGLAGLAAAAALAGERRRPVTLHEAAPHAGGRCRSFLDGELGCRIDNGNHLLLAGNRAALSYLGRIGALDTLTGPQEAVFPFFDVASGECWTLRPNRGPVPWWILAGSRRVPGSAAREYLAALTLRHADPGATVAERLNREGLLFRRLWEPLCVAALNTAPAVASARLFGHILAETLGSGGAACRPLVPRDGLSETFVDPAVAMLRASGAEIRFGARLKSVEFGERGATGLVFEDARVPLGPEDGAILAVPPAIAARLLPGLTVPDAYSPIVNAHFRCAAPAGLPLLIGLIGGTAEWVFRKDGIVSVTVSAADRLVDMPAEKLAPVLWRDVAAASGLPDDPVPPARIVKEKRATFLASPAQLSRRPSAITPWRNVLLAGDYVDTGLPATVEGAIRSGLAAARHWADRNPIAARRAGNGVPGQTGRLVGMDRKQQRALL